MGLLKLWSANRLNHIIGNSGVPPVEQLLSIDLPLGNDRKLIGDAFGGFRTIDTGRILLLMMQFPNKNVQLVFNQLFPSLGSLRKS